MRPSEAQLQKLDELVGIYKNAAEVLGWYLYDLNVELQNIFLSKLFNNKAPRRQPLDPKAIVVSTEPAAIERLRKYFEEDTDWGRHKRDIENEVKRQFGNA